MTPCWFIGGPLANQLVQVDETRRVIWAPSHDAATDLGGAVVEAVRYRRSDRPLPTGITVYSCLIPPQ